VTRSPLSADAAQEALIALAGPDSSPPRAAPQSPINGRPTRSKLLRHLAHYTKTGMALRHPEEHDGLGGGLTCWLDAKDHALRLCAQGSSAAAMDGLTRKLPKPVVHAVPWSGSHHANGPLPGLATVRFKPVRPDEEFAHRPLDLSPRISPAKLRNAHRAACQPNTYSTSNRTRSRRPRASLLIQKAC
jgi:hypothetical protein